MSQLYPFSARTPRIRLCIHLFFQLFNSSLPQNSILALLLKSLSQGLALQGASVAFMMGCSSCSLRMCLWVVVQFHCNHLEARDCLSQGSFEPSWQLHPKFTSSWYPSKFRFQLEGICDLSRASSWRIRASDSDQADQCVAAQQSSIWGRWDMQWRRRSKCLGNRVSTSTEFKALKAPVLGRLKIFRVH